MASLAALPFPRHHVAGVLLWYSTIHAPLEAQAEIYREVARVLRPVGHVLVGFQSGVGTEDVAPAYRRFGHDVTLHRHLATGDQVTSLMESAGLREVARLTRRRQAHERNDQCVLLGRAGGGGGG